MARESRVPAHPLLSLSLMSAVAGRYFLTKINANIGNSAVSSSIEEVHGPHLPSLKLPYLGDLAKQLKANATLLSKIAAQAHDFVLQGDKVCHAA